jgi:dihydrofolate synthase / folylpolyglutamate synthase
MRYEEAVAHLDARQPEHMPGPSLDRIRQLVNYLDHPERTYPTIHITGTNGKSTAARAVAAIACASGLSTGLYLSPHLVDLTERFSVCGADISHTMFAEEWEHLEPYLEMIDGQGMGQLTYFEAITGLAFLWFADKPVQLGVFEVGMGGSWDATNLVAGDAAVITPIGMDHVAELGPTLADIAGEKAGIIKEGKVAVIREQDPVAADVLRARGAEMGATLLWEGEAWEVLDPLIAVGGQAFGLRTPMATYEDLYVPVFGRYAARNAAAGAVAFEAFTGAALDEGVLRDGLTALRTPGRLEVVGHEPAIVLDGAHNPPGAEALAGAVGEFFRWERLHVVLAVSANKDIEGVVRPLAAIADVVYATRNDSVRSAEPEDVARVARAAGTGTVELSPSVGDAIAAARATAGPGDLVLVTGSLFTVGDAKRVLARS